MTGTVTELCAKHEVPRSTYYARLKRGWSQERALSTPPITKHAAWRDAYYAKHTPSYRWAFVAPSDALKCVADPALVTYTNIIDALKHASGSFVIVTDGNRVVAAADADDLLREFACNVALRQMHGWDAPDVVKEYLTTRNPDLREATQDVAWDAWGAWDVDWDTAWAVARAAAQDAEWNATWAAQEGAEHGDHLDTFLINWLRLST